MLMRNLLGLDKPGDEAVKKMFGMPPEDGLTFEKALKFAHAMEATNRDIVAIHDMRGHGKWSRETGSVDKVV